MTAYVFWEDHMQRVPLSQRSGEVIEPLLSAQWFVSTEVMAQRALDAVESGDIKIQPERFVKCLRLSESLQFSYNKYIDIHQIASDIN